MTLSCDDGATANQGTESDLRRTYLGQGNFAHRIHVPDFDSRYRFTWNYCGTGTQSLQRGNVNEDIYVDTTNKTYDECELARFTSTR